MILFCSEKFNIRLNNRISTKLKSGSPVELSGGLMKCVTPLVLMLAQHPLPRHLEISSL